MKVNKEELLAVIFAVLSAAFLLMFVAVGLSCPKSELDPVQQQIRNESMIF